MEKTVRKTIKQIILHHLKKKRYHAYGQCLSAVGWVGGTLPELYEKDGMIELPMADVAGGGFVVGAGLMGKRPIYIIRYQGFNWFNAPIILNYACKSKEIWNVPCPIFIRGIGMEGAIGPVAGSSHHSLYFRMPGIKIASPMTPKEYKKVYEKFMREEEVYYISEHRGSYNNSKELRDLIFSKPHLVIFAISITRFAAIEASNDLKKIGINVSVCNILWIKPFKIKNSWIKTLNNSKYGGLLIDDDYENGTAKSLAHEISNKTNKKILTLGLKNRSAGFSKRTDNLPPQKSEIVKYIKNIIKFREKVV
jgi:pyruvate/2-oxoglutarate/acetoin dehydrogenase E1 component